MAERKQRILSAMNSRKKRVRQLARENRLEAERARGQNGQAREAANPSSEAQTATAAR
jgi:hypothetical protein